MKITKEELKEFKILLQDDYPGKKFSEEQLLEIANKLLRTVELIYKPIPKEKEGKLKKLKSFTSPTCLKKD